MSKWKRAKEAIDLIVVGSLLTLTYMTLLCARPQIFTLGKANGAYIILGNSMSPTFKEGDMVLTTKTDGTDINVGDIITFAVEGKWVTHRVIEKSDWYRTKGDANEEPDTWIVPPQAVSGKYLAKIPYLGYVIAFVKSKYFLLFVSLPTGFYLIVTRTWETYELLTQARRATTAAIEKTRETYWWLKRLVEAYYFRGSWWRRVILSVVTR